MAVLTEDAKITLVQSLACFDTPTQAAEAVSQVHGIKIERMQAGKYDPTKPGGKGLSPKLKALFEATREKFLADASVIPIAQQAFRLRVLQRMLTKAEERGNMALASQLLEQAAKEYGGAFTNRREVTGKNGGPIQQANLTPAEFAETARRIAAEV